MISILMPVYNASSYLEECILSIINQTEEHWELIAVNDFSTDKSLDILNRYSTLDPRIKVFNNSSKGIIPALRLAFNESRGHLITRMDADDRMYPKKLELLKNKIVNDEDLALGLVEYFSESTLGDGYKKYARWLNTLTKAEDNFSDIYKECVIPSPCWMIKRITLEKCGAFNSDTYPEDYDLCFRMRGQNLNIKSVKEIIHEWRDHEHRASRNDINYSDNTFIPLKCRYFQLQDYDSEAQLILWGAGRKGKQIAKELQSLGINNFSWITDNLNKVGHRIYGIKLEKKSNIKLEQKKQLIMAIAQKGEKTIVNNWVSNNKIDEVFRFC